MVVPVIVVVAAAFAFVVVGARAVAVASDICVGVGLLDRLMASLLVGCVVG